MQEIIGSMDLTYISETFVNLLIVVSIALLLFFILISLRMIISLSKSKDKRRKSEKKKMAYTLGQIMECRFRRDMGKNR